MRPHSPLMVVTTSTKGTSRMADRNRSGRRLTDAPAVRPPADRPHSANRRPLVYLACKLVV